MDTSWKKTCLNHVINVSKEVPYFHCWTAVTFAISLLCRCDSGRDLCDCVCISHNGPSPLQEERDMSEPGGENSKTRRQPGACFQLHAERPEWEPERIFYLGGGSTCCWPGSVGAEETDWDRDALSSLGALHYKLSLSSGSTRQEDTNRTPRSCSVFFCFVFLLLLWVYFCKECI